MGRASRGRAPATTAATTARGRSGNPVEAPLQVTPCPASEVASWGLAVPRSRRATPAATAAAPAIDQTSRQRRPTTAATTNGSRARASPLTYT